MSICWGCLIGTSIEDWSSVCHDWSLYYFHLHTIKNNNSSRCFISKEENDWKITVNHLLISFDLPLGLSELLSSFPCTSSLEWLPRGHWTFLYSFSAYIRYAWWRTYWKNHYFQWHRQICGFNITKFKILQMSFICKITSNILSRRVKTAIKLEVQKFTTP